jgi:outer membrane biosynthesis protein TonB
MQHNPGPAGRRPLQDEVTVHIPDEVTVHLPDGPNGAKPPDGVTVLVPGAMLAPAPTPEAGNAGEGPVFVDDGGGRKRLMRLAGMLIALLSIGFIAIIGVALAVPNVATSVGLGDVVPYVVPGAAAVPAPKTSAPPTPPPAQPKPPPKPQVAAERTNDVVRDNVEPTAAPTVEPTTTATATAPTTSEPASTQTPPTQTAPTGGNSGGEPPADDGNPGSGQN